MNNIIYKYGLNTYLTDYLDLNKELDKKEYLNLEGCLNLNKTLNVHSVLVGIIHFSSSHSSVCKKKGFFLKHFSPFFHPFKNIWVKTNKFKYTSDFYARVKINWKDSLPNKIICTVEEYIGYVSSFDLEPIVIKQLVKSHWSSKVDKLINTFDFSFDVVKNRIDLTTLDCYSIDPCGCKDIDDALHYRKINDNHHEIGIHIADVSSYFPLDSIIWKEISKRVESVYMPNEIIHMYPTIFSTQIASLTDGNIKRTFSLILTLDNEYNIIEKQLQRTNVKVTNLTYNDVINGTNNNSNINKLYNIGKILYENHILGDEKYDSHKLVETYMVLANNSIAEILVESELYKEGCMKPLIRVQKSTVYNKESNSMVNYLRVPRAYYKYYSTTISNKHNGLNLELYTHFTSPIRRFADVIVHQLLTAVINNDSSLVPIVGVDTIYKLNYYKHYYKKCVIYKNEIDLVSELDNSYTDIEGTILDIYDNKCRVLVKKNNKEFIFDVDIFYHKINKVINVKYETDEFYFPDCDVKLAIGNFITIRVCYMPLKLCKLKAYIIEPVYMDNLI